jgi:ribosomal protein L11 methyltransferase
LADRRDWPALVVRAATIDAARDDAVAALVDECSPLAIEDLTPMPLPPGGLWDPTCPPPPEPPPSPLHWRVFFTAASDRDRAADALELEHPELSLLKIDVPDEDWAARSQRELTAVHAGSFIVAPPWDLPAGTNTGGTVIAIEPSRGFGTGHHQSTRLCLRALSEIDVHGHRVLDLGTGSGVLAIAAALRGAASVVGLDVDPDAIESAQVSHALNPGARGIRWLIADFRDSADPALAVPFDLVFANLTGGMLRSSAPRLRELIAAGGQLITSGFDIEEQPAVEAALQLERVAAFVEDTWVGLRLQRSR